MSLLARIGIAVLLLVGAFAGGYYAGKGDKEVITQQQVVYKEGETKTVYKDRIVTVIKTVQPDGTTTETTRTEDKDVTRDTKTADGSSSTSTDTKPALSRYSLGLFAQVPLPDPSNLKLPLPSYGITAGIRTLGEVWTTVGYLPTEHSVQIGIQLQFN